MTHEVTRGVKHLGVTGRDVGAGRQQVAGEGFPEMLRYPPPQWAESSEKCA